MFDRKFPNKISNLFLIKRSIHQSIVISLMLGLAFVGLFFPRFVNLNPYFGYFKWNNILDFLLAPADLIILVILVREWWVGNHCYKIFSLILINLGLLQIYFYTSSFTELADNLGFTFRLLLGISTIATLKKLPHKSHKSHKSLILIIIFYSFFDHLLLSNPIPVLWLWSLVQILTYSQNKKFLNFWQLGFGIILGLNLITSIWQTSFGHSLGLYLLGEPYLSPTIKGISYQPIGAFHFVVLRGYGLMQHPNILGFLGVVSLWFILHLNNAKSLKKWFWFSKIQLNQKIMSFGKNLQQFNLLQLWENLTFSKNQSQKSAHIRNPFILTKNFRQIGKSRIQFFWFSTSIILIFISFSRLAWISLIILFMVEIVQESAHSPNFQISKWFMQNCKKYWWQIFILFGIFLYIFLSRFAYSHSTDLVRFQEYVDFYDTYNRLNWTQKLFGVGLGQYTFWLHSFHPDWAYWQWQPIHNLWLSSFFEFGLIQSVLIAGFISIRIFIKKHDITKIQLQ